MTVLGMELEKEWAPPFLAPYKMDGSRRFCSFMLKLSPSI